MSDSFFKLVGTELYPALVETLGSIFWREKPFNKVIFKETWPVKSSLDRKLSKFLSFGKDVLFGKLIELQ